MKSHAELQLRAARAERERQARAAALARAARRRPARATEARALRRRLGRIVIRLGARIADEPFGGPGPVPLETAGKP